MNIISIAKTFAKNIGHQARKHAPGLLLGGGTAVALGGMVYACYKSFKVNDILDEGQKKLEEAKEPKEKAKIKAKTAGKLVLNYAGPAIMVGTGFGMIFGGHKILKRRHLATAAALLEVSTKYDKYRERIKEKYGEEIERKLLTGEHDEKVKETVTDPETGKEKNRTITKTLLGDDLTVGYEITLDRQNCYNFSNDFDSWMKTMRLIESVLNNNLCADSVVCGNAFLRLEAILKEIGVKDIRPEMVKKFKDAGVYRSKKFPMKVDLGLDEAQRLKDFNFVDESEMRLCIKVLPDIWTLSDVIEKGDM